MSLTLEIVAPDGVVVEAQVEEIKSADDSGRFGLLSGHQAFLTIIVPGLLVYREEGGRERFVAVDRGVMLLEHGRVSIATREAVVAERLEEVADAAARMIEARQTEERSARAAFAELESALFQQLPELERE